MSQNDSEAQDPTEDETSVANDEKVGASSKKSGKKALTAPPDGRLAKVIRARTRKRIKHFSILRLLFLGFLFGFHLGIGFAYHLIVTTNRELPKDLTQLHVYRPVRATQIFSADGEKIGELYVERRVLVPLARIPTHVQNAFIAAEDSRFYQHVGFDPFGIGRAAWANFRGSTIRQGASTITQQVARMLMLSNERTYERKLKELILAVRIDLEVPKKKVLEIYLNHVYLGHGAYGVQAAAEIYFAKDVEHLSIAEAAILAGLPKAPSRDSPLVNPDRSRGRQIYVLGRMRENRFITPEQYGEARNEALAFVSHEAPLAQVSAPYFVEHIRRMLVKEYGDRGVLAGGLKVYTTIDMAAQRAAENAVKWGLEEVDRGLGFRGPVGHLTDAEFKYFTSRYPAILVSTAGFDVAPATVESGHPEPLPDEIVLGAVTSIGEKRIALQVGLQEAFLDPADVNRVLRWRGERSRRIQTHDLISVRMSREQIEPKKGRSDTPKWIASVAQTPDVQAALIAMDPHTGDVKAMVGGYDYERSQFNRATQAHRQAGSSIKPLLYAAAIDSNKFNQLSTVLDAPVRVPTASGIWAPQNYRPEYLGPMTLRTALAKSINTVAVRLIAAIGVDDTIKMFLRLGLGKPGNPVIPRHPSISVGTPDVTLEEMSAAYATFPSGGLRISPRYVTKIIGDEGEIKLPEAWGQVPKPTDRALADDTAYVMTDLMQAPIERGTAKKAQALGRPVAGKTGTSNNYRDAWFIGYTTDLLAGVWVGRDNFTPIGGESTGGSTALPIWMRFMQVAHPRTPPKNFPIPPSVLLVRANEMTGLPALPGAPNARLVAFRRGTLPPIFGGTGLGAQPSPTLPDLPPISALTPGQSMFGKPNDQDDEVFLNPDSTPENSPNPAPTPTIPR